MSSPEMGGFTPESEKKEEELTEEENLEWDELRNDPDVLEFYRQHIDDKVLKTFKEPSGEELSKITPDLQEKYQRIKDLEKKADVGFFPTGEGDEFIIKSGVENPEKPE